MLVVHSVQSDLLNVSPRNTYALCVKLWQHNFTIVIVEKLLINGLCWEKFNETCEILKKLTFLENHFNKDKSVGL